MKRWILKRLGYEFQDYSEIDGTGKFDYWRWPERLAVAAEGGPFWCINDMSMTWRHVRLALWWRMRGPPTKKDLDKEWNRCGEKK